MVPTVTPEPSRTLAPAARVLWRLEGLVITVIAVIGAAVVQSTERGTWALLGWAAALVVGVVAIGLVPQRRWRRWRWEVREHEIDPLSDYPKHFSGELRIRLKDGSEVVHREAQNRGCPERPITNDEIVAKFTANASPSLGDVEAATVRNAVLGMEQAHSAREAIRAIVREEQ